MSPRSFILLLLWLCSSFLLPNEVEAKNPNILILYADDLGFGDLHCYNSESKIPTPHLDQLASEGIRFIDGHSSSGICTPSRYAMLTGRHHWRDFYGIVHAMGNSVFKPERLTLPEMLKEKGYNTAAIGKWHLGWDWNAIRKEGSKPTITTKGKRKFKVYGADAYDWTKSIPNGPLDHGFDYYFGDTVINFPPYAWIENDKLVKAPDTMMDTSKWKKIKEGNWECRPGPMCSDWDPYQNIPMTTKKGVDYIKAQAKTDRPFFLYFAYPAPHAPIIPNDKFDGKSKAGPYGDLVVETDDSIGQLLAALKESGQADNTIVIFSADNGPEKYAYARDQKYDHWSAKPLRGLKRDIYEGGHHVPFIIKYPGVAKAGATSTSLVSQIDIMATLASVVGYDLPKENAAEDSHDLLPLLKGGSQKIRSTHVHNTSANRYAIRHNDWVLVASKDGYMSGRNAAWEKKHGYEPDDKQAVELYNLKEDIGQKHNLAAKHPEKVKELSALLKRIREQGYSAPRLAK
jgi:arylsulfatase A|tara:strand:- start:3011 stop:4555 length:1545 start_codon:yes stop_codon:yes gene_type:complete